MTEPVIRCGDTHPDPKVEAHVQKARREIGAPVDPDACRKLGLWTQMYRCVECGRWFHRECARRHFATHGA